MRGGFRVEWLGMETEYSSYRLGLTEKRSGWLVSWLRDDVKLGHVTARWPKVWVGWDLQLFR